MLNQQATECCARSSPDANHRRKRPSSNVEAACPLSSVFDNQDRDNTEYGVRYPVERLDSNQRSRSMCKGVKNSAHGKDTKAKEQEGFSSLRCSPLSNPSRSDRYNKLRHDDARGHERRSRFRAAFR